jgi:hypothetical protein
MEIFQEDIFGGKHKIGEKEGKNTKSAPEPRKFINFDLRSGISRAEAESLAMLIQRSLQKKISGSGLRTQEQIADFRRLVANEIAIKRGTMDAVTATRDSLIAYYAKSSKKK